MSKCSTLVRKCRVGVVRQDQLSAPPAQLLQHLYSNCPCQPSQSRGAHEGLERVAAAAPAPLWRLFVAGWLAVLRRLSLLHLERRRCKLGFACGGLRRSSLFGGAA